MGDGFEWWPIMQREQPTPPPVGAQPWQHEQLVLERWDKECRHAEIDLHDSALSWTVVGLVGGVVLAMVLVGLL